MYYARSPATSFNFEPASPRYMMHSNSIVTSPRVMGYAPASPRDAYMLHVHATTAAAPAVVDISVSDPGAAKNALV